MTSCVYKITSPSGRFYIGSARNFETRRRQHVYALRKGKHHSRFLQRAWNKYGETSFSFSIFIVCNESNLFFYEQRAIDALNPAYNMNPSACGTRGLVWSEASRRKMRKPRPPEFGDAVRNGMLENSRPEERSQRASAARACWTEQSQASQIAKLTGRKDSSATVAKKIAKLIGHTVSPETRAKLAAQKGWKHSEAAKEKMRGRTVPIEQRAAMARRAKGNKNRLGAVIPDEMRARISAKLKGRPLSLETRRKMSEARRKRSVV